MGMWAEYHLLKCQARTQWCHAIVHPNVKAATVVSCDASGTVIYASLYQLIDGEWKPYAFCLGIYHRLSSKWCIWSWTNGHLPQHQTFSLLPGRSTVCNLQRSSSFNHSNFISSWPFSSTSKTSELCHWVHDWPATFSRKNKCSSWCLSRSCAELNAVLESLIDFWDMALCQHTDPDSLNYKGKINMGIVLERSISMESNYCVIQQVGAPDISFQHHGLRRCLTLYMLSLF